MQKSQKILIGAGAGVLALAAVAALAGPVVYRDFIAPPAASAPTLSGDENILPGESAGEALDPATLVGVWNVAQGSEAGYRVDEVLNGTDVTVTGRTDRVDGRFTIGADGLTLEAAELTVDVASISTDSAQRDAYFRDQALRTDEFPTAAFALTEPVALEQAPNAGDVVQAEATGDLTIAGATRTVTASVEVRSDGTTAEIAGSIPIVFADFGVEAPDLGFVSVEETGFVEFQLTAARQ
ncbi:YceI family protein [Leucobacter triazinivorans]|uniref:YceI family protein n=1 Tax=Leucobacter triazinivorans TaxID=1784719 RepID=A0A4P6KEX2_9MICO|nr:YceI family protein [Leucobacter triazinivorans]QBE48680.1 YceI family protein [Leucobacter triazinivorans]